MHIIPVTKKTTAKSQAIWGLWENVPERTWWDDSVLPSDMVENSTYSLRRHFELDVCHWTVRISHLLPGEAPSEFFCWHIHPSPRDMTLHPL